MSLRILDSKPRHCKRKSYLTVSFAGRRQDAMVNTMEAQDLIEVMCMMIYVDITIYSCQRECYQSQVDETEVKMN